MTEQILAGWCRLGQVPSEVAQVSVLERRMRQSVRLLEGTAVERFLQESHGPGLDWLVPLCVLLLRLDN